MRETRRGNLQYGLSGRDEYMRSALQQKYELARHILRREGFIALIGHAFGFLRDCLFEHAAFDVYVVPFTSPAPAEPIPQIPGLLCETVLTHEQLDDLLSRGFDLGIHIVGARERLNKGAMMLCAFVGGDLAGIHWVATTAEAMASINEIPFSVGFSGNEAFLGWTETDPRHRRLGICAYLCSEKRKVLLDMGKTAGRCFVEKSNFASRGATIGFGGKLRAEGRYFRILWWKSWKEWPIVAAPVETP